MSQHTCNVAWQRGTQSFVDNRYSRAHAWRFDGGALVPASSSPYSVKLPFSDPAAVDPEEALVAAVSSCHMLWFLSLAAQQGYRVDTYVDDPKGVPGAFDDGRRGITQVVLRPAVVFSGDKHPDEDAVDGLHHDAHERCDIANSLRSQVRVEGSWRHA